MFSVSLISAAPRPWRIIMNFPSLFTRIAHSISLFSSLLFSRSLFSVQYKTMHPNGLDDAATGLLTPVREATSRESCQTLLPDALLQNAIAGLQCLDRDGLRRVGMKGVTELHEQLTSLNASLSERIDDVSAQAADLDPEQVAFVTVVGHGIANVPHLRDSLLQILEANDIACTVPDAVNGSSDNFTVVVWEEQEKKAKNLLHSAFVGKKFRRMDVPGADQFWTQQRHAAMGGGSSHF